MVKEKILALILGIAGVALTFFCMTLTHISIADINYERWEIVILSDALLVWSISFIFGILALVFHGERKSPYLMAISTIGAAVGYIFPYIRFYYYPGGIPSSVVLSSLMLTIAHLIMLLASAILLAYINIWKKSLKEKNT